jgi:group I intron endonuclease
MSARILSGIYWIRNTLNGKRYVGSAVNVDKRLRDHRALLNKGAHHCRSLQYAWVKHSEAAFIFEPIEAVEPTKAALDSREQAHLDTAFATGLAYNICRKAGSCLGVKRSAATRGKMSLARKSLDLKGEKFGRLTALKIVGRHRPGGKIWLCACECGKETRAYARQLIAGGKKSCGCLKHDACQAAGKQQFEHGHNAQNSRTYISWMSMRARCNRAAHEQYPRYGGRGIKVCERWSSFANFLADMGERPAMMTLGRVDNGGDYEPGNCRWESLKQQARNRRGNRLITYQGKQYPVAELCEITGLSREKLTYRLDKSLNPTVWVDGVGTVS